MRRRALVSGLAVATVGGGALASIGVADSSSGPHLSNVPAANQRAAGYSPAPRLSPELQQIAWAQGTTKLENPSGIVGFYGYQNDVPSTDNPSLPQTVPLPTTPTEAQKTEPDKNTYLTFKHGQSGPDSSYDYGT